MLKPGSTLGELGDTVTDVSIYELNLYSCLGKSLDDLVLLVPETIHQSAITPKDKPPTVTGPCMLSFLFPITFFQMFMYLESMKFWVVKSEWFKETTTIDSSPLPSRFSLHRDEFSAKSSSNFIGRIVSMDINGIITVRLAGTNNCRDICVPLERILMVIDDDSGISPMPLPSLGMLDPLGLGVPGRDGPSIIRTYEYDESSSGEWETDDEMDELGGDEYDDENYDEEGDDNMADADDFAAPGVTEIRIPDKPGSDHEGESNFVEKNDQATQNNNESSLPSLPVPSSCPLGFSLLECSPPSDHHFLHKSASGVSGVRIKRIRKEFEILESALPPGIFVRTWESRIDLLRVMIIGPQGTPYEYAPFVIDFQFSEDYPNTPPASFFHLWTNGQGRINPNLYEDGKICLSILGTWPTKNPEESWSPIKSTILQILVSIMGLVLVKTPFYNEAGYEALAAEDSNRIESTQYTEKAFLMTRNFIKHVLEKPVAGFEDVLTWNYLPDPAPKDDAPGRPQLLRKTIDEALAMIEHHNNTSAGSEESEEHAASPFVSRLSLGAVVMLRRHISALEKIGSAIPTTETP